MSQLGAFPGTGVQGPLVQKEGLQSDRSRAGMPLASDMSYVEERLDFKSASEFDTTNDWTVTTVDTDADSGSSAAVLAGAANGILQIVTDDNALDSKNVQKKQETYQLAAGCPLHLEMRLKVDDVSECDLFVGLAVTDTTARDAADRLGFAIKEADANGSIYIQAVKDGTSTATDVDSGVDAEDDTFVRLNLIYDGSSSVSFHINGNKVGSLAANLPNDEQLALTLSIKNGSAAASTLSVDYLHAVQKRSAAADV